MKDIGNFPLYEWPDAVDYHELISHIEEKHGVKTRDYAGKYSGHSVNDHTPYLDYWHQHCDDVVRGGANYLDLNDEDWDGIRKPDWICEINHMIREEVLNSPAYDPEEQSLRFYVDW